MLNSQHFVKFKNCRKTRQGYGCAKKVICNVLLKLQTSKAYLKIENLKRSYLMKIIKFSPGIARMLRKIFDPCTAVKHFKYKCHWISLIKILQREKVAHTTKCEKYVSGHKRGPSVRMYFLYFFTSFLCTIKRLTHAKTKTNISIFILLVVCRRRNF